MLFGEKQEEYNAILGHVKLNIYFILFIISIYVNGAEMWLEMFIFVLIFFFFELNTPAGSAALSKRASILIIKCIGK